MFGVLYHHTIILYPRTDITMTIAKQAVGILANFQSHKRFAILHHTGQPSYQCMTLSLSPGLSDSTSTQHILVRVVGL
jgi:hypothetical protein